MDSNKLRSDLRIAPSQELLPHLSCFSTSILTQDDESFWLNNPLQVMIPAQMKNAIPKRLAEFIAGRSCAAIALENEGYAEKEILSKIQIHPRRFLVWPSGYVGSITHSFGHVAAAIARTSKWRCIGIDSERLIGVDTIQSIRQTIATSFEINQFPLATSTSSLSFTESEYYTLIFSAKESVYKALFPMTGVDFGFLDLELISADLLTSSANGSAHTSSGGSFEVRLRVDLEFLKIRRGHVFSGRFSLSNGMIHSAFGLPSEV